MVVADYLAWPRAAECFALLADEAKAASWSHVEYLAKVVAEQASATVNRRLTARLRYARFPYRRTLDDFDFDFAFQPSVDQKLVEDLATLRFIEEQRPIVLLGQAGTGKSHLLVALGHHAVDAGKRVRYFSATDLVETLYRGLADNSVGRVIEQILKADLVLIDEIGFAPMDDTGAQLSFRLVAAAYETRSLGIGSHWPFEDWGRFLPEHTTAVSLLDRLLHHSVLVVTSGESFRLKESRRKGGGTRLT